MKDYHKITITKNSYKIFSSLTCYCLRTEYFHKDNHHKEINTNFLVLWHATVRKPNYVPWTSVQASWSACCARPSGHFDYDQHHADDNNDDQHHANDDEDDQLHADDKNYNDDNNNFTGGGLWTKDGCRLLLQHLWRQTCPHGDCHHHCHHIHIHHQSS